MKQLSRRRPEGDDIELDLGRYELRRDGRRIKLEKKPMELLIFLVRRRQQLVSREEIQAKLWHTDLFIDTERNINNIVRKIRRALGDNSAKPRFLETVVGKGYRFVGPIRIVSPLYGSSDLSESADGKTPFRSDVAWGADRSSLAVLPLLFFGDLEDDNGLSLGFADSLV
jgi:DNA-binding winged helix-turn-helix (wHTH) protein